MVNRTDNIRWWDMNCEVKKKNQRWPKGLNLIIKTNDSEMIKMRKIRERFESRNTMHSVLVVSVVWCLLNSQMEYVVHQIIDVSCYLCRLKSHLYLVGIESLGVEWDHRALQEAAMPILSFVHWILLPASN